MRMNSADGVGEGLRQRRLAVPGPAKEQERVRRGTEADAVAYLLEERHGPPLADDPAKGILTGGAGLGGL